MPQSANTRPENDSTKWMLALTDDSTELSTNHNCVTTADLYGDGDTKLVIADIGSSKFNMTLKVFKGVKLTGEIVLAETPTALVAFINDQTTLPTIGVAAGHSLLIYKNLKPFYKYTLPNSNIHQVESDAWAKVQMQELTHDDLFTIITNLSKEISPKRLSPVSQTLLIVPSDQRKVFIDTHAPKNIVNAATITCVAKMKKSQADLIDILVCGTEKNAIHVVDSQAFTTIYTISLPSTPVQIITHGTFEVDYRIFVSTRDGKIFSLKRDMKSQEKSIIQCPSPIVAFVRLNRTLVVGTMDNTLTFYTFKGKRLSSLIMDQQIRGLENFYLTAKEFNAVLVLLETQVRLFNEQYLLDIIKSDNNKQLSWIRYGVFGREDGALIMGTKDGGLVVKLFRRKATLDTKIELNPHPMPHNIKLNIPKKTKIFIDQTVREKDNAAQINQTYQKDLFLLRYQTTSAFAHLATTAITTVSTNPNEAVDISMHVNGFGPKFRVTVTLCNSTNHDLTDLWLSFVCDSSLYKLTTSLIPIGILVPTHFYTFETYIECLNPEKGFSEELRALLIREDRPTPIVTAIVNMPISEMSLLD